MGAAVARVLAAERAGPLRGVIALEPPVGSPGTRNPLAHPLTPSQLRGFSPRNPSTALNTCHRFFSTKTEWVPSPISTCATD